MISRKWIFVFSITVFTVIIDGLSSTSGHRGDIKLFGGYRITPKFCKPSKSLLSSDPRSHGPTICMFNNECTQRGGEVVGACMDSFLFGTCCQLHGTVETPLTQTPPNHVAESAVAVSYENYGSQSSIPAKNVIQYNEIKFGESPPENSNDQSGNYGSGVNYNQNYYDNDLDSGTVENESTDNYYSSNNQFNNHYVGNDAVVVSSPSSIDFNGDKVSTYIPISTPSSTAFTKGDMYLPPSPNQTYSEEFPTLITSTNYDFDSEETSTEASDDFTSVGVNQIANTLLSNIASNSGYGGTFTHSDITHPSADSVLMNNNGSEANNYVRPSDFTSSDNVGISTTNKPFKVTYAKPVFKPKPKPTESNTDKYVLVHTISNDKTSVKPTIAENDMESIESIILMLNESNPGPQYNSATTESIEERETTFYTSRPAQSTSTINYDKYGPTSFYITTKLPSSTLLPPSINNLYSSGPTRRPISDSYSSTFHSPALQQSSINYGVTSTQSDSNDNDDTILISSPAYGKPTTTTKRPPSTSYISSTSTSKRPTTTAYKRPNTRRPTTAKPTTRKPSTSKPPSTSYVYSPYPTRRPQGSVTVSTTTPPNKKITTEYGSGIISETTPTVIVLSSFDTDFPSSTEYVSSDQLVQAKPAGQKKPSISDIDDGYVQISNGAGTGKPSPTVHITPKPPSNVITLSSWSKKPTKVTGPTKPPSTSYISSPATNRPGYQSTSTGLGPAAGSYGTTSLDFDDAGYFGPQKDPIYGPGYEHTVSSTAVYSVLENDGLYNYEQSNIVSMNPSYYDNSVYGPTLSYPDSIGSSTLNDQLPPSQDDLVNFPPDRNPNLNTSTNVGPSDGDVSTPAFVEDDVLDDKMNLLVSKIVASLQGNFENLADIVLERNESVAEGITTRPAVTITKRPSSATTIKRPTIVPTRRTTTKPTTSATRPPQRITTTKRPTTKPSTIQTKPTTVNTRPAVTNTRPGSTRPATTTKKPTVTRVTTTRKPATQQQPTSRPPVRRPTTTIIPTTTRRPGTKVTTTRRPTKPTKKVTTTTIAPEEPPEEEYEGEEGGEETDDDSTTLSTSGDTRIQCGIRPQVKSGRIVGGKSATFGEFPWQVLVRESTWLGLFTKNKCGGVLISNSYVMTAAHCQPGFLASLVTVFGEYDISGELEVKRSVTKNVKRVIVHRQYDAATFENDLALLELESPIHYDTHIVPICMPPDNADFTGRMATVSGWGRLKYGGGVPSVLQEVRVPVIENSVCQEMFQTAGHNKKILSSFLCAGYANGQKDSCEGDSGGPLVLQRSDGRWELAGTVSHGIKCAAPYLPGVYMRTTFYKPWLQSIAGVH